MYLFALIFGALTTAMVVVYFLRSPYFSIFHPLTIYSMFHALCFVIRPIFGYFLQYHQLYSLYGFIPTESDKITVIAATNIGYLAFAFSCLRSGSISMQYSSNPTRMLERNKLINPFIIMLCILGPIATYSLSQNFVSDGNFDGMMNDRMTGIAYNTKSNGYLTDAQLMLAPLCALIAWFGRFRIISLLPLLAFVLVRGGSGGRGPFVAAVAMTLLLYLYERKKRYPNLRVTAIILALSLFFAFIGENRGEELRSLVGLEQGHRSNDNDRSQFMETMDLGNMEFFEYIVWVVPQRSGTYDYFLHNLQIFTEPVPRIFWPSKPLGPPIQFIRLFDYGYPVGMTFSLPGVGWYSLGWLGVVLWCSLWGHFTGLIYRKFVLSDHSTIKIASYIIFVSSLIVAFRDGMLISVIKQSGAFLAPIVFWLAFKHLTGAPSLAELTRMAGKRFARAKASNDGSQPASDAMALRDLPPAVQRRRLALHAQSSAKSL